MSIAHWIKSLAVPSDTVPVSPENPLPVALAASAGGVTPTNAGTLTITAGGTAQDVFAALATRRWFMFQNISDAAMWLNFGADAAPNQPSLYLAPGAYFEPSIAPTTRISVYCATTSKAFVAKEA